MPTPESTLGWGEALAWFGVVAIASFLVSWVMTDLFKVGRTWYVGLLAVMTGGLTYGYLAWSGTDALTFVRTHWAWGLLGALLSGGVTALGSRRMRGAPIEAPRHGLSRAGQVLWEDVVYGASEGMLLSVLPVLTIWQALERLGWTTGWTGKLGTGALSLGASLVVIGVHHLGYSEFRGRQLVFPVVGCLWFSLAYVLTASPLAAMVGHMGLHGGLGVNRMQLPPYRQLGRAPDTAEAPKAARAKTAA
jgi:hypothetical protein